MSILIKVLAVVMLPLSILVILTSVNIKLLNLPFNLTFLGVIIMIIFQILNFVFIKMFNEEIHLMQIITGFIFIIPAVAYLISIFTTPILPGYLEVILGTTMCAESLYALH